MGKKKKKSGKKKIEEKKIEEKKAEEKKTEEKKAEEKKTEEKKAEEKKAAKKKPEEKKAAKKKSAELSESEKKQREKNRQKALKESRSKKSARARAKFQKQREKAAKQKAVKRVRKVAAKKEQIKKFFLRISSVSLSDTAKKNILISAFIIAVIMINIAVFMTIDLNRSNKDEEETASLEEEFLLEEEEETPSENTVSSDEEKEEEPEEEKKESSSFNAAKSKEKNLQDVFPHEGGLYFMPVSNDEKSVTGALLGTCILKKDEYDALNEGDVVDFADDRYMILSISRGGDYGTALSMTAFDEDEDYERVFKEEKSYEDYFGIEKIVYGLTLALEEEQIKQMGSPDYFADDGYDEDDMIFFAGMSLYFPLTYMMDEDVTLEFDEDCVLTVPDDTFIGDEEYDVKDYLAGKNTMFPPDLMAAKIETDGNRITKYNVMIAGMDSMQ
ncbi:MAG: hypothetical protein J5829_09195 [Lachnospiraceae bacterium]|nr:hypothetical protein [Lachnospiraceae bacterium]